MAKPKRYYYICDPHMAVATAKRITSRPLNIYFFDLKANDFICKSLAVTARENRAFMSSIAVPLEAAKRLANFELHNVYALHVPELAVPDDEKFIDEIQSKLDHLSSLNSIWYAPAGIDRGVITAH